MHFISNTRTALVDTIAPLQHSDGVVIATSEVHDLITKIHYDIRNNTVSKPVGNMVHILVYLFNSALRKHHEVWASQFPFLHSFKGSVPPIGACLYGHIYWFLAQVHHQFYLALSQSSISMRGARARPKAGF